MKKYLYVLSGFVLLLSFPTFAKISSLTKSPIYPKKTFTRITTVDPLNVRANYFNPTFATTRSETDTIQVLALRVEFESDNLATTTGDGRFDKRETSDFLIDRPPHNKSYFEDQLLALKNYFKRISKGQLILESSVFPQEENNAYQLPQNIVYYSGQGDEELQKKGWAELLRDAVNAALNDEDPGFSQYDVLVVFHAGVGSDFSFDFDPTPFDIQSAFIDFETLQETLADNNASYPGIPAGPDFYIKEGIILPETQNQEDQDLAMLGTMTLLMGSQLGMPNLYDTKSGNAGIGRWGLMDQGSFNFQGLISAEPDAWTKVFMGWEDPVLVTSGENLAIGINQSMSPHIYKIPISSNEYFLIENRQTDWNGDGITIGRDENGKRAEFDSTGTIAVEEGIGVITTIDEYDFGVPGSGILIWHIDEQVIADNLKTNTINNNRDHRGVDLVECDGAQDLGYVYDLFSAGFGTESGDYFDPYWLGNESHKIVNDTDVVELSPSSIPNSNAHNGAITHIRIYNFSSRDSVMTFSVASDVAQDGFPQYAGTGFSSGALLSINQNETNRSAIFAASKNGRILAWKGDGSRLIENDEKVTIQDGTGKDITYDLALFATTIDSLLLPLTSEDINNDGVVDLIALDNGGTLYIWATSDADADGRADLVQQLDLGAKPTAGPMILSSDYTSLQSSSIVVGLEDGSVQVYQWNTNKVELFSDIQTNSGAITGLAGIPQQYADLLATTNNNVFAMTSTGTIMWQTGISPAGSTTQPLVAHIDNYQGPHIVVISNGGDILTLSDDGQLLENYHITASFESLSTPGFGDIDMDGLPEILLSLSNGFSAFELTGVPTANFPAPFAPQETIIPSQAGAPLFFKSDEMTNPTVFVPTPDGLIRSYDLNAVSLQGFPLTTSKPITTTPVLSNIDSDNHAELAVLSEDGFLYVWNLPYSSNKIDSYWTHWGGRNTRTFDYSGSIAQVTITGTLLPTSKVFCYPNPTNGNNTNIRYTLTSLADRVTIRIYDLAGEFVQELQHAGMAAGDHETVWDISAIESGVYIARVEADNGSDNNVEFIKIAVVK